MRKGLSLLLALLMLISYVPNIAFGADEIQVYISVAENGGFVKDKNGDFVANRKITVLNENPTLNDVFTELHNSCYEGGAEAGYETTALSWGAMITKFFGKSSSAAGYRNNHAFAMGVEDSVEDGAYIIFFFYQDAINWTDSYVKFDKKDVTAEGGEKVELMLTDDNNEPVQGAVITIDGERTNKITDENGKAQLYFSNAGKYIVSAESDAVKLVPPVCTVEITSDYENTKAVVDADTNALEINLTATENLTLPSVGISEMTLISWKSDDETIITNSGEVKKSVEEKEVKLIAKVSFGNYYNKKEFIVTVPALSDEDILAEAKKYLEETPIILNEYNEDYSDVGDTNIKTAVEEILSEILNGITVSEVVSSENEDSVSSDGTITYKSSEKTFNVTVKLKKNEAEKDVTFSVTVPKHSKTRQSAMDETAEILEDAIKGNNSSLLNVTEDLNFTRLSSYIDFYVQVEWTIPNDGKDYLDRYGSITRPAYGEADVSFVLTATLKWYSMMEGYMPSGYVGGVPSDKIINYNVTVKAYTEEEYNLAKEKVDNALNNFDKSKITYFSDKSVKADLDNVKESLMLPDVEGFTNATEWKSKEESVIASPSYKTGSAVVKRPALNEEDKVVILEVTISENGYSNTLEIPVTVKALTSEDIESASENVKKVAESINFDVIKKKNILPDAVTEALDIYKSASVKDDVISWSKTASPLTGYKIEWTYPTTLISQYGAVTRPNEDTNVTLKAKVSDVERDYAQPYEISFDIVVLAGEDAFEEMLLSNIANKYISSSEEWKLMDMAAYQKLYPESENKTTDKAKQDYINTVIPKIAENSDELTLSKAILILTSIGTDSEILYPVNSNNSINAVEKLLAVEENSLSAWVAPYVIIALSQKDYDADDKINSIITGILASQNEDGSWSEYGDSVQTTANMIACLSLYYNSNETVKAALDRAVSFLSSVQKEDGTYDAYGYGDDTNTAAMIVIALSSLGINSDTDERFIKNGTSAYEALFKYMLDDLSGFGYNDKNYNDYSTEQAFRAVISAVNVAKSGKAYNVYDFSENELVSGRSVGNGNSSRPSIPDTDDTIDVKISIKGKSSYWLNSKLLTLKKGSSIYHALVEACEDSGITCYGADDGYVYKMSNGKETLEEFGEGADSGWLYKVNGKVPNIGIMEYELQDGDKIVWFYTVDWQTSAGFSSGGSGNEKKVIASELIKKIASITKVNLKSEALINELLAEYNSLADEEKKLITNSDELFKAFEKLEELKSATENISFDDISVHWAKESITYVTKNGYMTGTDGKEFSPDDNLSRGMLVTVLYRIANEPENTDDIKNPYNDVRSDAYYYDAVRWANKESIVTGTERKIFSPDDNISREEFVTMLYRYADGDIALYDLREYEDADNISEWAVNSFKWAVKNGIIQGKSEGKLAPKDNITRAEAAAIIERFVK